ncbi:MAG: flagellar hook assembly protein FlgD [Spirochaetales bacterium]|jgi:flagellar basal-body rod modification protein FlgD|nr:flagellar hook assembly protein FlgD [Spirochaetales bacterium]
MSDSLFRVEDLPALTRQNLQYNEELKLRNVQMNKNSLDQADFIKLLTTQLSNQDPANPMNDREFIAQLAQFSSLQQITGMSQEFAKLSGAFSRSQAVSLLGREVTILQGERTVTGTVEEVIGQEVLQLFVNGSYYDFNNVMSIANKEESAL